MAAGAAASAPANGKASEASAAASAAGSATGRAAGGNAAGNATVQRAGRQNWRVTISRDKLTVYLDYVPKPELDAPLATEILKAIEELGPPPEGLFDSDKIEQILRNAENSRIPLRQYPISEDLEGGFSIDIDDDGLRAALTIRKGRGRGQALNLKEVGAALRASGIKKLDFEKLKTDILTFYRSPETVFEDYELATGSEPEKGEDQEISWEVEFMSALELTELKKAAEDAPEDAFKGIETIEEFPIETAQDAMFITADHIIAALTPPDQGKTGTDVLGKIVQGIPGEAIKLELHEGVKRQQDEVTSTANGILERWETDGTIHLRIRPHSDAQITPSVAADGMTASVSLAQGTGTGSRLHAEDVRQALIAAEVIRGIDLDAVEAAVRMADENGSTEPVVVAKGETPQDQEQSSLSFKIDLASGKGVTIKDNGRADYRNQDRFTTVEEGTLIAEIITPDTNQDYGFDVRGNKIEPPKIKELNLQIGENIVQETDEQGRLQLKAGASGELAYDGKSINIVGVHTVKGDVGPSTGNVRFAGPVNITGNVLPGFVVMATGAVKIGEGVETALISSEKSIHINQGVKGGGKAAIRAREHITAAFAEQVVLMAVQDISVKNACLQCSIKCNGKLKLETEKGHLVGGQTKARSGAEVANLGSKNGAKTNISFGQDYLIGDKIDLEQKELEKLKEATLKTDALIRQAEKDGDTEALSKHRAKKVQILKLNEKRTERLFWLREKFEQHYDSEITVRGTTYPGVVLESHGRTHEVTVEKQQVVFYFNREKGIIEDRPLSAEEK